MRKFDSGALTWTRWGSGYEDFLRTTVRTWLEEQGTVSPDGNPWE